MFGKDYKKRGKVIIKESWSHWKQLIMYGGVGQNDEVYSKEKQNNK